MNLMLRSEALPNFDKIKVGPRSKDFSDHVKVYRLFMFAKENGLTAAQLIRLNCRYEGVDAAEILRENQTRAAFYIRFVVIQRVAAAFPHLSSTQMGRFFNRGHVSILYYQGRLSHKAPRFFTPVNWKEIK